jgi:hypothetical protein
VERFFAADAQFCNVGVMVFYVISVLFLLPAVGKTDLVLVAVQGAPPEFFFWYSSFFFLFFLEDAAFRRGPRQEAYR